MLSIVFVLIFSLTSFAESREDELVRKVKSHVATQFCGDYEKCFQHYAGKDKLVNQNELFNLLSNCNVGRPLFRNAWVRDIMNQLDTDKDGELSWDEVKDILK